MAKTKTWNYSKPDQFFTNFRIIIFDGYSIFNYYNKYLLIIIIPTNINKKYMFNRHVVMYHSRVYD